MAESRSIRVKVVYALPYHQLVEEVTAPIGSTAREIVESTTLVAQHPEIDLRRNKIGIYGRLIEPDAVVDSGDRIEIYRPLCADPKSVRRRLAKEGKTMGKKP